MTYSTAFYRAEAQAEEKVLNWFRAARLWRKAVEVYPNKHRALAQLDIANMLKRAAVCDRMEQQEGYKP